MPQCELYHKNRNMKMIHTLIISLFFVVSSPSGCFAQSLKPVVLTEAQVKEKGVNAYFKAMKIDDEVMKRMRHGGSFPVDCTVKRESLRYLKVLHYNFNGEIQTGELVCNAAIADELIDIFKELYRNKYQIDRMVLIDEYGADDELSMRNNNSSAFCFRRVNGSTRLSKHARGLAIDINPLQNPCVRYNVNGHLRDIEPDTPEARKHIKRNSKQVHMIDKNDLCYKLFIKHGFRWGGSWRSKKDYQHFEK
jgi:hypothetical protein